MTWHRVSVDSVICTLESGSRPKGGVSSDRGDVPSLGGENIMISGGVTLNDVKLVPAAFYTKMTKGHLEDGDVLINKDGAQTGKVGWYRSPSAQPSCINEHLFLLRGIVDRITQGYLYYTLLSEAGQNQIRMQISGSAQPGLKSDFVKSVVTDIPEGITEQSTVVEILSTVDWSIEQTEMLIAKQQRIKTGLMQDLFTRGIDAHGNLRSEQTHKFKNSPLGRIPVEWEVESFGTACNRVSVGIASSTTKHFRTDGVPLLRNQNVLAGRFDLSDLLHISREFDAVNKSKRLRSGDLVTMRTGYPGRTAVVTEEMQGWQTFTTLICSPNTAFYLPAFMCLQMNAFVGRKQILQLQGGGAQQNLNVGWIKNMRVLRPQLDEQRQAVACLEALDSAIAVHVQQRAKLGLLKNALMQDLLSGTRRVTALLNAPERLSA